MSKLNNLTRNAISIILSGAILVTSGGVIIGMVHKNKEMSDVKEALEYITEYNAEKFQDAYELYDRYIELIKNEIVATGMDKSAIEVFATYELLQNNGLLSLGSSFNFGEPDYEVIGNLGMSVVTGTSVCRNQAYNLYRLFQSLGYEVTVCHGELYETTFAQGVTNHALVCVHEGNMYYLFDPTNATIFLRSVTGQWISMDHEDKKFDPSPYANEMFETLDETAGLHWYFHDDYGSCVTYRTRRNDALSKAMQYYQYYIDYENEYLKPLEEELDHNLRVEFNIEPPDEVPVVLG